MPLSPAEAAGLYHSGLSACQIAERHKLTRQGAEARIRAGGLGGLQWCPIHQVHEELRQGNAEAVSYMYAKQIATSQWVQPALESL